MVIIRNTGIILITEVMESQIHMKRIIVSANVLMMGIQLNSKSAIAITIIIKKDIGTDIEMVTTRDPYTQTYIVTNCNIVTL